MNFSNADLQGAAETAAGLNTALTALEAAEPAIAKAEEVQQIVSEGQAALESKARCIPAHMYVLDIPTLYIKKQKQSCSPEFVYPCITTII